MAVTDEQRIQRNKEYWIRRFEDLESREHQRSRDFAARIDAFRRRAMSDIEKEVNEWYKRLAENNSITLDEARKLLIANELAEFHFTIEDYLMAAIDARWKKELDNLLVRTRISRLQQIQTQIQQTLEELFVRENEALTEFLGDQYETNYLQTAFTLERGINVGVALEGVNRRQLLDLLRTPWTADGFNFSDRLWEDKNKLIGVINTELVQGIARGVGPERTISIIQERLGSDVSRSNIRRLVITESVYFSSRSQQRVYRELGVDSYEILATLDRRTSSVCRRMDGRIIPIQNLQPGVTAPPFHPNCRTTTVPYFDPEEGDLRFARDAQGNGIYIPANIKYEEWYDRFIK